MIREMRAYLELARPANVVTAFADILAGFAATGALSRLLTGYPEVGGSIASGTDLIWLLFATAGLYAGGVVLNDVFDAELDATERPERPIPSGRIERKQAALFGGVLLLAGISAAAFVGSMSLIVALIVAACAVLYDWAGKHHAVLGPINMGLCRGGNLLLGMSAVPAMVAELWFLAAIPVAYIGAVTAISSGEVEGGTRITGILSILLVGAVTAALVLLGVRIDYRLWHASAFIILFVLLVYPPFVSAFIQPSATRLRKAVKTGVLSLIVVDAALAGGFGGWRAGLLVLVLLPVSYLLGRVFAVT